MIGNVLNTQIRADDNLLALNMNIINLVFKVNGAIWGMGIANAISKLLDL